VSNEIEPSDECSSKDMLSEFRGVTGRNSGMEGSDKDYLYFFSKNVKAKV